MGGVSIALALSVFYTYRRLTDPTFPVGTRAVVVLLILLNSRQNLRQYRYASLLLKLGDLRGASRTPLTSSSASPGSGAGDPADGFVGRRQ